MLVLCFRHWPKASRTSEKVYGKVGKDGVMHVWDGGPNFHVWQPPVVVAPTRTSSSVVISSDTQIPIVIGTSMSSTIASEPITSSTNTSTIASTSASEPITPSTSALTPDRILKNLYDARTASARLLADEARAHYAEESMVGSGLQMVFKQLTSMQAEMVCILFYSQTDPDG